MNGNSFYEKTRLRDRLKDFFLLFVFITASLIVSIIIMDATVFPFVAFAKKHKELFNLLVKHLSWTGVLAVLIAMLIRRLRRFRKDGMTWKQIGGYILLRPVKGFFTGMAILILSCSLLYVIYLLMNSNYYLLYKIIN